MNNFIILPSMMALAFLAGCVSYPKYQSEYEGGCPEFRQDPVKLNIIFSERIERNTRLCDYIMESVDSACSGNIVSTLDDASLPYTVKIDIIRKNESFSDCLWSSVSCLTLFALPRRNEFDIVFEFTGTNQEKLVYKRSIIYYSQTWVVINNVWKMMNNEKIMGDTLFKDAVNDIVRNFLHDIHQTEK